MADEGEQQKLMIVIYPPPLFHQELVHVGLYFHQQQSDFCRSHETGRASCCRYVAYLFFQLKTHRTMFNETGEEEDEEEPVMSLTAAVIGLSGVTVVVAISAE